jgi:hypothetical protein
MLSGAMPFYPRTYRPGQKNSDKWRVTKNRSQVSGVGCRVPGVRGGTRDQGFGARVSGGMS